jgi:hypothetical protein
VMVPEVVRSSWVMNGPPGRVRFRSANPRQTESLQRGSRPLGANFRSARNKPSANRPRNTAQFTRLSYFLTDVMVSEAVNSVAGNGSGEPDGHELPITTIPASVNTNRRAISRGGTLESERYVRIAGKL